MKAEAKFENLVDTKAWFYGATEHQFKLGARTWQAIENPDDGYRSYLDSIEVVESKAIFFSRPLAKVSIETDTDIDGYRLVDVKDGHVWLRFGTDNNDDYYPWFVFDYQPKAEVSR